MLDFILPASKLRVSQGRHECCCLSFLSGRFKWTWCFCQGPHRCMGWVGGWWVGLHLCAGVRTGLGHFTTPNFLKGKPPPQSPTAFFSLATTYLSQTHATSYRFNNLPINIKLGSSLVGYYKHLYCISSPAFSLSHSQPAGPS